MLWIKYEASLADQKWEERARFLLSGFLPKDAEGKSGHFMIGRDSDCDLQIENAGISRDHAKLVVTLNPEGDVDCFVEDLKSKNGTQLNDQALEGVTQLRAGDVLSFFGKHRLVFFDAPAMVTEVPPQRAFGETHKGTLKVGRPK